MSNTYAGTSSSDNKLQVDTTTAAVVASGAEVINCAGANYLRVWLGNTTAAQGGTLLASLFSQGDGTTAPTIAQQTMSREFTFTGTDNTATADSAPFTGTTGSTIYTKDPLLIYIGLANRLMLNMAASDGGSWYCRYELLNFSGGEGASITNEVGDIELGAVEIKDHDGSDRAAVSADNELRVLQGPLIDLDIADQSKSHTHDTAGSTETIAGDTAFGAGATLEICGIDTWVAVGDDDGQASGGDIKRPAGVPFLMRLDGTSVNFSIDAATGGEVSVHQVR